MSGNSPDLDRVRGIARLFAEACWLPIVGLPLLELKEWYTTPADQLNRVHHLAEVLADGLHLRQRTILAGVHLVPVLLLCYGFFCARRSLIAFGRGDIFAREVPNGLRDYAAFGFWSAVASFLAWPVESLAITMTNPAGHRVLSVGVSAQDVFDIVRAGIVWVLAIAMARACMAARENSQFV